MRAKIADTPGTETADPDRDERWTRGPEFRPPDRLLSQLLEYGAITRSALSRYLRSREPARYLYDLVAEYPRRGGRMIGPSLCLATSRAFGGSIEETLTSATALELARTAVLVHQDVADDWPRRRGYPSLHRFSDVPLAINAGDMLIFLAIESLLDNRDKLLPPLAVRIFQGVERAVAETLEGWCRELEWRRLSRIAPSEEEYLDMVLKKVCWLETICPMWTGAAIATRGEVELAPFIRLGFFLGAAFQIQEEILGWTGNGAPPDDDRLGSWWPESLTLPIVELAHRAMPAEHERLSRILRRPRHLRLAADRHWILERLAAHRCIEHARRIARGLAGAARYEFAAIFGGLRDSEGRRFLQHWVHWVGDRI